MRLITHLQNVRHLIGFTGTSGFMLLGERKNYFFTDFRYRGVAQDLEETKIRDSFTFIELDEAGWKKLVTLTEGQPLRYESTHVTVDELAVWKKRLPKTKFAPTKHTIEDQRLLKDSVEIKKLKKSQQINEETLKRVQKLFKTGVTELELAWQIKVIGHELSAEDISFEPIVGFGPHSAIPHHQNTSTKLKANDLILVDMGMKFEGYCSDMTRTFLPKKPTAEQVNVYEKVLRAQTLAIAAIKPGVSCKALDEIARKSMGKDAKYFGHSLGHGVGLDVHEAPNLSSRSKDILEAGMVVTVEPGIYLDGRFGVRIEDCGLVTTKGYENFMSFEK